MWRKAQAAREVLDMQHMTKKPPKSKEGKRLLIWAMLKDKY